MRRRTLRFDGAGGERRLKTGGDWESQPLDAVAEASRAARAVEKLLRESVARARAQGCSWTEIGQALGTSRQSAWERFAGEA
jgi:hypothetical protein